jgi:hypothetical protein
MALATINRMSSPRRDSAIGLGPNRDPAHGDDEDVDLKFLPEFSVENTTRAEVHSFSPLTIHQSPGNLFGDTSDPNEPTMAHESNVMPGPYNTYYGNNFFPPQYSNQGPPPQFSAYHEQQHIRSQFRIGHHGVDHPPPLSPPHHYGFEGDGHPPPEPIQGGPNAFSYQNDGMNASYAPPSAQEHFNYHSSFNTFDAPAYQFDNRDVPHNQAAVSDVYGHNRFPLHRLHTNGNRFQFPQTDESMDRKPAAVAHHPSQAMYSHRHSYPQQASSLPTYPTQDANVHRMAYHPFDKAFKKSTEEPFDFRSLDGQHPPQESHKRPPPIPTATSAAISEPALRRTSQRRFDPPTSHSPLKKTSPVKQAPKRMAQTRKKTTHYRAAGATVAAAASSIAADAFVVPTRVTTSRSSTYTSQSLSAKFAGLPSCQTSPTPQELEEARTPRKQDALINWFQRLNDLRQFKEENGHSRFQNYSVSRV